VGLASDLPNIRGTTSTADRWVWGQRFRGSPDKLRTVATTWRKVERITTRVLNEVQDCWDLVRPARGRTADATNRLFLHLCGHGPCLARVDEQAALLANLPAACGQLAQACEHYAANVAGAKSRVPEQSLTDPLTHPLEGIYGTKIGADGLRDTGGLAVEGKYVKNPDQCDTPRSLDRYLNPKGAWEETIHKGDETEMEKYRAAMAYPGNDGQLRGVEVCTNDHDTVDYFDAMMAARHVHGYARYVPLKPGATIPLNPGVTGP
jgi:hypothetical protein